MCSFHISTSFAILLIWNIKSFNLWLDPILQPTVTPGIYVSNWLAKFFCEATQIRLAWTLVFMKAWKHGNLLPPAHQCILLKWNLWKTFAVPSPWSSTAFSKQIEPLGSETNSCLRVVVDETCGMCQWCLTCGYPRFFESSSKFPCVRSEQSQKSNHLVHAASRENCVGCPWCRHPWLCLVHLKQFGTKWVSKITSR